MLHCYICNRRFLPRTMFRIDGKENTVKMEITIQRRQSFDRSPVKISNLTRLCINCNLLTNNEIVAIEQDSSCLRLNVIMQTKNNTCLICNADVDIHRLSIECRATIFIQKNIYCCSRGS